MLVDIVADERAQSRGDPERERFLAGLFTQLLAVEAEFSQTSASTTLRKLRQLRGDVESELATDSVVVHLEHCIEELERLRSEGR